MGTLVSSKTISPTSINCNDLTKITLSLTASPDINDNPVDIMLVLDRSSSMNDSMTDLKDAAKEFVQIIKNATNPGNPSATDIGAPSRIGIVSFATNATLDLALTGDVSDLNGAINALVANGRTNHKAAFELATTNLLATVPTNRKILVMFTDGDTTEGGNADGAAQAARAAGIEVYCIGLGNIDTDNLEEWASLPTDDHVIISPTAAELVLAFQKLAESISPPGAIGITVVDTVEDDFEIVGPATFTNPVTTIAGASIDPTKKIITWTLNRLGYNDEETATISFNVRYLGSTSATLPVNKTITYNDLSNPENTADFPGKDTEITIDCQPTCDNEFTPDCCEPSTIVDFDSCETMIAKSLPDDTGYYTLKCDGRILSLQVRLNNICPGRKVAVGVIVTEILGDAEVSRGFRAVTVPAQILPLACPCGTVIVDPIVFVLPEDVDNTPDVCDERSFRVKVIAHYMDTGITDFNICPASPRPTLG